MIDAVLMMSWVIVVERYSLRLARRMHVRRTYWGCKGNTVGNDRGVIETELGGAGAKELH